MRNNLMTILNNLRLLFYRIFGLRTKGVKVMLIKNNQILLVHHSYQQQYFMLPGGGVHHHETFEHAARREIQEELNIEIKSLTRHGVFHSEQEGNKDKIVVFISTDFDDAKLKIDMLEISEARWFALNSSDELISPATKRRIVELNKTQDLIYDTW